MNYNKRFWETLYYELWLYSCSLLQILTGVVPEGFTELQSQVIASNPKLKTTSFPFAHLLTNSQSELNYNNEMIDKMVGFLVYHDTQMWLTFLVKIFLCTA